MSFSTFDIMLPIGLAAVFGLVRYSQLNKTNPDVATRVALADAVKGAIGMGIMTVIMKYLGII